MVDTVPTAVALAAAAELAYWMGLSTGAAPSEGAVAWQLQLLFDFQVLAWGPR